MTHSTNMAAIKAARESPPTARPVQLRVVAHDEPIAAQALPLTERALDDEGAPSMMKKMRSQLYASLPSATTASIRMTATLMAIRSADGSLVGAGILGRF